MHYRLMLGVIALCTLPASAHAQLRFQVGGGVTASSLLVTDSIVEPIRVGPGMAATLTGSFDGALDSIYRVGVRVNWTSSTLRSTTPMGTTDIVGLTVWEPAVRLGRAWGALELGVLVGLQVYRAARPIGIFRDGGKVTPEIGLDAVLQGPRLAGARLGLGAEWSVSRFSTTTLSLSGFSGEQTVHRVGVRLVVTGGPDAP